MARHNDLGHWGEDMAVEYLVGRGYAIMERNYRVGGIEIDIIATYGLAIIFVEVKTRTTPLYDPAEAVDSRKAQRLCMAVDRYMRAFDPPHIPQIDIIAIVGTPDSYTVTHYPDAFMPRLRTR